MKKLLALLLVVILTATVSISGTLAFYQAGTAPVDTMADGDIKIDQQIYYRDVTTGDGTQACTLKPRKSSEQFPLYPAVYDDLTSSATTLGSYGNHAMYEVKNIQDQIVVVENDGTKPAYIRTWFAIECGSMAQADFEKAVSLNQNSTDWTWEIKELCQIEGKMYYILLATYNRELAPGATTPPSLLQVMLNKTAGNAECAALDGDGDGKLDIKILSQAAARTTDEEGKDLSIAELLNAAFGSNAPWT